MQVQQANQSRDHLPRNGNELRHFLLYPLLHRRVGRGHVWRIPCLLHHPVLAAYHHYDYLRLLGLPNAFDIFQNVPGHPSDADLEGQMGPAAFQLLEPDHRSLLYRVHGLRLDLPNDLCLHRPVQLAHRLLVGHLRRRYGAQVPLRNVHPSDLHRSPPKV